MLANVDFARNEVSHAKIWVSGDCGTNTYDTFFLGASHFMTAVNFMILDSPKLVYNLIMLAVLNVCILLILWNALNCVEG